MWAQNQPNRQNTPGVLRVYLKKTRVYMCMHMHLENARPVWPVPSILPQILPQTKLSDLGDLEHLVLETQGGGGKLERNRMELQTPSGFPGNFRKRKVLGGPYSGFPLGSGLPETLVQAKAPSLARHWARGDWRALPLARIKIQEDSLSCLPVLAPPPVRDRPCHMWMWRWSSFPWFSAWLRTC